MYPKSPKVVEIYSRIAGFGLPFSEGQAWDRKRRILNKVFNFDFVKSQTSKIAKNCEYSIKEMEKMGRKDES
jgi:cytochrome P450